MRHIIATLLLGFWMGITAHLAAQSDFMADDVQLRGVLGTKLKIEMLLRSEKAVPFFQIKGECIDIIGEYGYLSQVQPISLSGRLCPSDGSFFLRVGGESNEVERFEGKWNPSSKQLTGTWILRKTGKTMPFTITAMEVGTKGNQVGGFYQALNAIMQQEPHVEGARIEEALWSDNQGKIKGFQPNWGGDVLLLAPTRLEFYTSYNSTGRSTDYEEIYQLLPSPNGIFVAHLFTYSGFEKSWTEDEEEMEVGEGNCGYELSVYQWVDGEALNVTEQKVPAEARAMSESASGCSAHIMSEAVLTPNGEKLVWDGLKFVK